MMELIREQLEIELMRLVNGAGFGGKILAGFDALRERVEMAERALLSHGYRKSCDIPACNCGDQWRHGGHASERLREIRDALPYANGKTILQQVEKLVGDHAELEARVRELEFDIAASGIPSQVRTWTTDKPTAAGCYWFKCATGQYQFNPCLLEVEETTLGITSEWLAFGDKIVNALDLPGEWAGPIPLPQEGA